MANGNDYTTNEMIEERQNAQERFETERGSGVLGTTQLRPEPTNDPTDQDTFAEILAANVGAYVLIQFLIGSSSLVDKEGYLYAVGANFVTIYEPIDDRYVVSDLYSVKFVTIYNTPPIGNSYRTGNAMSYSGTQNPSNTRYTRNYGSGGRRMY